MIRFGILMWRWSLGLLVVMVWANAPTKAFNPAGAHATNGWQFNLRYRAETKAGSGRFHTLSRQVNWDPKRTAVIVCDVWDAHHSINAVRRAYPSQP